ncbi:MAG: TubC N-terminal docking domain-related protein [Limisphaerales bacterium]
MSPEDICTEATRRGLRLEPRGEKLAVSPAGLCPPEFADILRQHKAELLAFLAGEAANLPPDQRPWLHVARQILAGEFAGCDRSTRESLTIGLRSIRHPTCREALARLTACKP